MADKKKMSVADMLAAARKADVGAASDASAPATEEAAAPAAEEAAAPEGAAAPTPAAPAAPKKIAASGGGRPSVAEMLAAARAGGAAPAPAAKKPAEKPAAPKAPAAKPAPAKAAAAAAPAPDRETGSVLGGGHKKDKPGPMTKAEAAANPAPARAPAAPQIIVPPKPTKPDYAKPKPAPKAAAGAGADDGRRDFLGLGFWLLGAVSALWTLATVKFMFPNVLREPPSKFKVGFPDSFPQGQVSEKFKAQYKAWIVCTEYDGKPEIFALKTVCTHLGCTPNWLEAEQKFKCPCHGSGYYKDGINFEGPAPRPLERYAIRVADDGQIEVDSSRTFQEEMGQWADASCFIPV